jgi:hypothetical protein
LALTLGAVPTRSLDFTLTVAGEEIATAWDLASLFEARRKLSPEDRRAAVIAPRWTEIGYPANR